MDIGNDLQRAYDDGYKKGWQEAEAYIFHCGDETPITNADRIRAMSDEELAEYLNNKLDGCCGKPCDWNDPNTNCETCWLEWLKQEVQDG